MTDNESVTVSQIMYFLYKNSTQGASDATSNNNNLIVTDVSGVCGGSGYELFDTIDTASSIRNNIQSTYITVSIIFTFIVMIFLSGTNIAYISFYLKEH
jgi:hypothetical protein